MTTPKQDAALQAISDFGQQWEQLENARLIIEKQAQRIAELEAVNTALLEKAQAVVDRWDTPLWKDVPATAVFINELRAAIAQAERKV